MPAKIVSFLLLLIMGSATVLQAQDRTTRFTGKITKVTVEVKGVK